jgi:tRNA(fMet)-specific endonuclease VapC
LADDRDFLLDTMVLVHLARAKEIGLTIAQNLNILGSDRRPLISRVTHGEAKALARGWGWGQDKQRQLEGLLRNFVTVELDRERVIDAYVEIYHFVTKEVKNAKPGGENDVWIAASAMASDSVLVTADDWFNHIAGIKISCIQVQPQTGQINSKRFVIR